VGEEVDRLVVVTDDQGDGGNQVWHDSIFNFPCRLAASPRCPHDLDRLDFQLERPGLPVAPHQAAGADLFWVNQPRILHRPSERSRLEPVEWDSNLEPRILLRLQRGPSGERIVATTEVFANMPLGTPHSFKNESNKPQDVDDSDSQVVSLFAR
jgi:hypothetical protein